MSIGRRLEEDELLDTTLEELYNTLGERDTAKIFQDTLADYEFDYSHTMPTGAGISVNRERVYVDSILYQQAMDNEFKKSGLTPNQIITCWIQHEITEKSLIDGDNPVDLYKAAHNRALRREHELVGFFESTPEEYETAIYPALDKCYARPLRKPPLDWWIGPILDNPDERGREILEEAKKAGVLDASKHSKYESHYGLGSNRCVNCRNWMHSTDKILSPCREIAGLVRNTHQCDFYIYNDDTIRSTAKNEDIQKLAHELVQFGPARGEEACRTCRFSDHGDPPKCAYVTNIRPSGWCRLFEPKS